MQLNTVIFDMDGLLIDSEPLWNEAVLEVFKRYDIQLSTEQYLTTTGLRTQEFVAWWFDLFKIASEYNEEACKAIVQKVKDKVLQKGKPMPGLSHILNFFIAKKFKIGLASSSPIELIEVTLDHLGIKKYIHAIASAGELPHGKPHPQVYLDCAAILNAHPLECICFEDSFNGMIAVKAARMKCVVVPSHHDLQDNRWHAADLKISSLQNFNDLLMQTL
jgi:mannitol-1-/sugar-/sorbitol-6-/2-deoxyglucose-6-phosphatase